MEQLSINDPPPAAAQQQQQQQQQQPQQQQPPPLGAGAPMPMHMRGPPQLPPQMFTTAAQLLDLTDSKLALLGGVEGNRVIWGRKKKRRTS